MTHTPIIGIVQDKYAFPDALHFLELGKRLGAQHLELKFELNLDAQYNLRGPTALEIRKKAEQHRISLSVHAPYDDGVNLGAADSETWEEDRFVEIDYQRDWEIQRIIRRGSELVADLLGE